MSSRKERVTRLLNAPDETASEAELLTRLYDELRQVAGNLLRGERSNHTLQPTALVHEAWSRMVDVGQLDQVDRDAARRRFLSLAARSMRRVLIDHARARKREKRGGGHQRVTFGSELVAPAFDSVHILDIESALQVLEEFDPKLARVAELRLFAGLEHHEVAETLGVSRTTAMGTWALARALMAKHLSASRPS